MESQQNAKDTLQTPSVCWVWCITKRRAPAVTSGEQQHTEMVRKKSTKIRNLEKNEMDLNFMQ